MCGRVHVCPYDLKSVVQVLAPTHQSVLLVSKFDVITGREVSIAMERFKEFHVGKWFEGG